MGPSGSSEAAARSDPERANPRFGDDHFYYALHQHKRILWLVSAVTTLLNHGILYTKAVVDRLAYLDSSAQEPPRSLEWKRAWNLEVLRSNSSIAGILMVALFRRVWQSAYLIGSEVVDDAFAEGLG